MDMSVVGGGPTVDIGGGGDAELESDVSLPIPKAPAILVPSKDRPELSVKFWSTGVASPLKTPAEIGNLFSVMDFVWYCFFYISRYTHLLLVSR